MNYSTVCFCLAITITYVAGDCWMTRECQQNSWKVKGCAQYGRVEKSKIACRGGFFCTCCIKSSSGASSSGSPGGAKSGSGKTTCYWDCCKPSCSWPGKAAVSAPVRNCEANGINTAGIKDISGCDGGNAFVYNNQQPFVKNHVAYGFAAASLTGQGESSSRCTCYELTFTSGTVKGKKMIVQVTNTGSDLGENHFDLMIPGGGVGAFNGCSIIDKLNSSDVSTDEEIKHEDEKQHKSKEWGAPKDGWGARYGGISSVSQCNQLPVHLREGCKFRFGWFANANNPTMTFKSVTCPRELTSRSGCVRR